MRSNIKTFTATVTQYDILTGKSIEVSGLRLRIRGVVPPATETKSMAVPSENRLPMPRSIVRARSHGTSLSWVFFICPFARSFALLTHDIGVSRLRARVSASSTRQQQQAAIGEENNVGRVSAKNIEVRGRSTATVDRIILVEDVRIGRPSRGWVLSSWASNSERKRRHAGRYWRFVQVVRRPGRRRVQKYNDRRPNTDHRAERPRECQEGFQFRLAQGRAKEKGSADRGPPWERLDRLKVMSYIYVIVCVYRGKTGRQVGVTVAGHAVSLRLFVVSRPRAFLLKIYSSQVADEVIL